MSRKRHDCLGSFDRALVTDRPGKTRNYDNFTAFQFFTRVPDIYWIGLHHAKAI